MSFDFLSCLKVFATSIRLPVDDATSHDAEGATDEVFVKVGLGLCLGALRLHGVYNLLP